MWNQDLWVYPYKQGTEKYPMIKRSKNHPATWLAGKSTFFWQQNPLKPPFSRIPQAVWWHWGWGVSQFWFKPHHVPSQQGAFERKFRDDVQVTGPGGHMERNLQPAKWSCLTSKNWGLSKNGGSNPLMNSNGDRNHLGHVGTKATGISHVEINQQSLGWLCGKPWTCNMSKWEHCLNRVRLETDWRTLQEADGFQNSANLGSTIAVERCAGLSQSWYRCVSTHAKSQRWKHYSLPCKSRWVAKRRTTLDTRVRRQTETHTHTTCVVLGNNQDSLTFQDFSLFYVWCSS